MMKLSELPKKISGYLFRDGQYSNMGMLHQHKHNKLCPIRSSNYLAELNKNKSITCVIVPQELVESIPDAVGCWVSEDPLDSFFQIHNYFLESTNFYNEPFPSNIDDSCVVSSKSQVSKNNIILHKHVTIGDFTLIQGRTEIGSNSKISSNVNIGDDGFEVKKIKGVSSVVKHGGNVYVGENVEIHSFSSVDRGLFNDQTFIGNNVKVDKYVHIAHNAIVQKNTIIASSVKIMGSANIGKNVFLSLGVLINNKVIIGDGCFIGPGENIVNNIPENSKVIDGKITPID